MFNLNLQSNPNCHLCAGKGYITIPKYIILREKTTCPACQLYHNDCMYVFSFDKEVLANKMEIHYLLPNKKTQKKMVVVGKFKATKCNIYTEYEIEPGNEQYIIENMADQIDIIKAILADQFINGNFNYRKDFN